MSSYHNTHEEIDWEGVAADQALTIHMLTVDIGELLDIIVLAKNQGSRKNCNELLETALNKYR